jgi:hypothetical protein
MSAGTKGASLARTAAGATLLPLCALPYRSKARERNLIVATLSPATLKLSSRAARALWALAALLRHGSERTFAYGLWADRRSRDGLCPATTSRVSDYFAAKKD